MPRPPRRIVLQRVAPDGRRYTLEERPGRPHPQIRIWVPAIGRYRRMTLPTTLRGPDGQRDDAAVARAFAQADEFVTTEPALGGTPRPRPLLVSDALEYACDPRTTKKRRAASNQHGEWLRARREVEALQLHHLAVSELTGEHLAVLARSAMLRTAIGCDLDTWAALLARRLARAQLADAQHIAEAVTTTAAAWRAQRHADANAAHGSKQDTTTGTWGRVSVHLLCAMFNHARTRGGAKFRELAGIAVPRDLADDLHGVAEEQQVTFAPPSQPRRSYDDARALMRHLTDPRYYMAGVLATVLNEAGALRARRTQIRVDDEGVAVRHNNGSDQRPQWTWYRLDPDAAAVVQALLGGEYHALEEEWLSGGPDYRVIADVRWDGERLTRIRSADDPPDPEQDGLLDQRAWVLDSLGVEGRGGQVLQCRRSDLLLEGSADEPLLDVPGTGRKRGPWWLLAPAQLRPLSFALRVGYLADYERAFRKRVISDYPLFPEGRLVKGRARVAADAKPIDRKRLEAWNRDVARLLGLTLEEKEGRYGWRRCFIDLFEHWESNPRVKDLITGHDDPREPSQSSTRVTVYLSPKDLPLLRAGRRLMEHVRTTFVRTGEGPGRTADQGVE